MYFMYTVNVSVCVNELILSFRLFNINISPDNTRVRIGPWWVGNRLNIFLILILIMLYKYFTSSLKICL